MSAPSPFAALASIAGSVCPRVALVLGSGMSGMADRLKPIETVPFVDIPGLPAASVTGHKGCLKLAKCADQAVLVFEGRLHYYEGHPWRTVTLPVRTAAFLGARVLVLTNTAGGIRDDLDAGSLMAVTNHIDWTRANAWRAPGPECEARTSPYSARLLQLLMTAARETGVDLRAGVYAAVTGPCYETPAEIRALRLCRADAVGMSTAREIEAGAQAGMECCAVSCITNRAAGLSGGPIMHDDVLASARARAEVLADLLEAFLRLLAKPIPSD
jgi:purine-nucleoside phosphorylase